MKQNELIRSNATHNEQQRRGFIYSEEALFTWAFR